MSTRNLNDTTVMLHNMAQLIRDEFGEELADATPYAWWARSKLKGLPVPMPEPLMMAGARSPVWNRETIVKWYKAWKGIG